MDCSFAAGAVGHDTDSREYRMNGAVVPFPSKAGQGLMEVTGGGLWLACARWLRSLRLPRLAGASRVGGSEQAGDRHFNDACGKCRSPWYKHDWAVGGLLLWRPVLELIA